jgi:hypothetical protein
MRCDQRRKAGCADDRVERLENMMRGFRIEIASWLVGEQYAWDVGDHTGNRTALLLAVGQFGRPLISASGKSQIMQQLAGAVLCLASRQPADHLRQHDIFERGKLRQQMMELIDETDLAAPERGARVVDQCDRRFASVWPRVI